MTESQSFSSDLCLRILNDIPLNQVYDKFIHRPEVQGLSANRYILLKIIKENLIPVLKEDKLVGVYECTLLYHLLTHKYISLPHLMLHHMTESKTKLNKPYGVILTDIFAANDILEVTHCRARYFDMEYFTHCGLVNIDETFYMKREFQDLPEGVRVAHAPRRSMSSIRSSRAS
ncbi:hypothetical protein DM860_005274 [Cuscuta australis]|uniref:Uncharacterized protein n=1 Tax=Cuscuta australis TaxID=267555 RepID=A0A328E2B8_9ASTE|nr:hypothetical protein DM860_005274 [Cuscuta australis]